MQVFAPQVRSGRGEICRRIVSFIVRHGSQQPFGQFGLYRGGLTLPVWPGQAQAVALGGEERLEGPEGAPCRCFRSGFGNWLNPEPHGAS